MATQVLTRSLERQEKLTSLSRMVVAYDFSEAADRALADAMTLARRFQAEILLVYADSAAVKEHSERRSLRSSELRYELSALRRKVAAAGLACREIVRLGEVTRVLVEAAEEEAADLLLVGAYGNGSNDRHKLGSTAEKLLRVLQCPILIYGPQAFKSAFQEDPISLLVPIEHLFNQPSLTLTMNAAKLLHAQVDLLHVVDVRRAPSMPEAALDTQYNCEMVTACMKREGLRVSQSLLFGRPDEVIIERSREMRSSLILMPLGAQEHLMSDHVTASVVRCAAVPVMTCRVDN